MHPCMGALCAARRTAAPISNTCFANAETIYINKICVATIIAISADPTALFALFIWCSHR